MKKSILLIVAFLASPSATADVSATIKTTAGSIQIVLFEKRSPATVANFTELVRKGFYDGKSFHQIIPNFNIQTGATSKKNNSGPGYCLTNEFNRRLIHKPGTLSMLRSGGDTNGSQFAITMKAMPHLDGYQPIFGQVTKGMNVVSKINSAEAKGKTPVTPVKISSIEIGKNFNPKPAAKILIYGKDEITKIVEPQIIKLLENISNAQDLGSIEWLSLTANRSRCAQTQINFVIDFENARGSQILVYGDTDNDGFLLKQFQFKKGGRKSPSKGSPLHNKNKHP